MDNNQWAETVQEMEMEMETETARAIVPAAEAEAELAVAAEAELAQAALPAAEPAMAGESPPVIRHRLVFIQP